MWISVVTNLLCLFVIFNYTTPNAASIDKNISSVNDYKNSNNLIPGTITDNIQQTLDLTANSYLSNLIMRLPDLSHGLIFWSGNLMIQLPMSLQTEQVFDSDMWFAQSKNFNNSSNVYQYDFIFTQQEFNTLSFVSDLSGFLLESNNDSTVYQDIHNYKWFTQYLFLHDFAITRPPKALSLLKMDLDQFTQNQLSEILFKSRQCCSTSLVAMNIGANVTLGTLKSQLPYTAAVPTYIQLDGAWLNYEPIYIRSKSESSSISTVHNIKPVIIAQEALTIKVKVNMYNNIQPLFVGRGTLMTHAGIKIYYDVLQNAKLDMPLTVDRDLSPSKAIISWIPFGDYIQAGPLLPVDSNTSSQAEFLNQIVQDPEDQWHQSWLLFDYNEAVTWKKNKENTQRYLLPTLLKLHYPILDHDPLKKLSLRGLLVFPQVLYLNNRDNHMANPNQIITSLQYEQLGRIYGGITIDTQTFSEPILIQGFMHGRFDISTSRSNLLKIKTNDNWYYQGYFNWKSATKLTYGVPGEYVDPFRFIDDHHRDNRISYENSDEIIKEIIDNNHLFNSFDSDRNTDPIHSSSQAILINFDLFSPGASDLTHSDIRRVADRDIFWSLGQDASLWFNQVQFGVHDTNLQRNKIGRITFVQDNDDGNDYIDQSDNSVNFFGQTNIVKYDLLLNGVDFWLHRDSNLYMMDRQNTWNIYTENNVDINIWSDDDRPSYLGRIVGNRNTRLNIFFSVKENLKNRLISDRDTIIDDSLVIINTSFNPDYHEPMLYIQSLHLADLSYINFINVDLYDENNIFTSKTLTNNYNSHIVVKKIKNHPTHSNVGALFMLVTRDSSGKEYNIPLLQVSEIFDSTFLTSVMYQLPAKRYPVKSSDYQMWYITDVLPWLAKSDMLVSSSENTDYSYLMDRPEHDIYNIKNLSKMSHKVFMPADAQDVSWAKKTFQGMTETDNENFVSMMSLNNKIHLQQRFWYPDILYLRSKKMWTYLFWPQDWVKVGELPSSLRNQIQSDINTITTNASSDSENSLSWINNLLTVTPQAAHRSLNILRSIQKYAGASVLKKYILPAKGASRKRSSIYSFMALASQDIAYYTLHASQLLHDLSDSSRDNLRKVFHQFISSNIYQLLNAKTKTQIHDNQFESYLSMILKDIKKIPTQLFSQTDTSTMFSNFAESIKSSSQNQERLKINLPVVNVKDFDKITVGWNVPNNANSIVDYNWSDFWQKLLYNSILSLYRKLAYYTQILKSQNKITMSMSHSDFTDLTTEILRLVNQNTSSDFTQLSNEFLEDLFPFTINVLHKKLTAHYQKMLHTTKHDQDGLRLESISTQTTAQAVGKENSPAQTTGDKENSPAQTTGDKENSPTQDTGDKDEILTQKEDDIYVKPLLSQSSNNSSNDDYSATSDLFTYNQLMQSINTEVHDKIYSIQLYDVYIIQNLQNFILNNQIFGYLQYKYKSTYNISLGLLNQSSNNLNWNAVNIYNTSVLGLHVLGEYNFSLNNDWNISTNIAVTATNITHHIEFQNMQLQDSYDYVDSDISINRINSFVFNIIGEYQSTLQSSQIIFLSLGHSNMDQVFRNYDINLYPNSNNLFFGGLYKQDLSWLRLAQLRWTVGGYIQIHQFSYDYDVQKSTSKPSSINISTPHLLTGISAYNDFYVNQYHLTWQLQMRVRWKPNLRIWDNINVDSQGFFELHNHVLNTDNVFVNITAGFAIDLPNNVSGKISASMDLGKHTNNYYLGLTLQFNW